MSTEVASTRISKDMLREIDREATARGLSRSIYLAHLIEQGAARELPAEEASTLAGIRAPIIAELQELRESHRALSQGLRELRAELQARPAAATNSARDAIAVPLVERLTFSTFFCEALLKRVSATLYRNPGELAQVVREARQQATAEAQMWCDRMNGGNESGRSHT